MGQVTGVVTRVDAGRARIECGISDYPACGACASGRGCGWQRSNQPRRLEIPSHQGSRTLQPGDRLEVQVDDTRLLRAACRLYLPPLAGLLAGPALLRFAGWEQGITPLLAAVTGLAAGGLVAWRWTRAGVPVRWQWLGPAENAAPGQP
ncbi:MAG: Positive regulator of sigma(E), RseC/MucC [Pseudomonadota bacterium]